MKVGIVVPFSWSYWGGVVEHAENQARALMELGHEARIVIGNDPPGQLTRLLHPRAGRHGPVPEFVIPVGRTVIVPANASLSNVCLTPQSMPRIKRAFQRERFDVVHVHEPLAPIISQYALAAARCPIVTTSHSAGGRWWKWGYRFWHVLLPRIDYRIAVSEEARRAAEPYLGGPFEIIPNGVGMPETPRIQPAAATTSSSSAGTSLARACTCSCRPGPRCTAARVRACASWAPIRSRCVSCCAGWGCRRMGSISSAS
jgi:phosphatidylinositol alpha-mannosyltransferase